MGDKLKDINTTVMMDMKRGRVLADRAFKEEFERAPEEAKPNLQRIKHILDEIADLAEECSDGEDLAPICTTLAAIRTLYFTGSEGFMKLAYAPLMAGLTLVMMQEKEHGH